jgi:DNA polymerase-3 subunit alpha/error-prone DNA polymerase
MYINCHSYHSLRYGTIPLNELVQQAASVVAMALTDINTVTGIYDFIKECKAVAIKPLVGIEFRYNNNLYLAKKRRPCGNEPFSNPT